MKLQTKAFRYTIIEPSWVKSKLTPQTRRSASTLGRGTSGHAKGVSKPIHPPRAHSTVRTSKVEAKKGRGSSLLMLILSVMAAILILARNLMSIIYGRLKEKAKRLLTRSSSKPTPTTKKIEKQSSSTGGRSLKRILGFRTKPIFSLEDLTIVILIVLVIRHI